MVGLSYWSSFVEKEQTRNHSKVSSISVDTFMKMMNLLTASVMEKIAALLPGTFGLVFDGWAVGQTHYLGVFATYPKDNTELGYNKVLLSFVPLTDEESFNADAHIAYFEYILELYDKDWSNVAALIGDNCSMNRSFAGKVKCCFIGCESHQFNLAMNTYFKAYTDFLK